ncbi:MAG: hypothetical protein JST89_17980 [Cyanobacteria bacterium SZAS-4]|nr:hypothetical protein [Cyanobacteria bacterium SZAS-4]
MESNFDSYRKVLLEVQNIPSPERDHLLAEFGLQTKSDIKDVVEKLVSDGVYNMPIWLSTSIVVLVPICFLLFQFFILSYLINSKLPNDGSFQSAASAVMTLGVCANILVSIALCALFERTVINRIATVRTNMLNYSKGETLSEPLTGKDLIAGLDQTFRQVIAEIDSNAHQTPIPPTVRAKRVQSD